jgi:hypothetical protein
MLAQPFNTHVLAETDCCSNLWLRLTLWTAPSGMVTVQLSLPRLLVLLSPLLLLLAVS